MKYYVTSWEYETRISNQVLVVSNRFKVDATYKYFLFDLKSFNGSVKGGPLGSSQGITFYDSNGSTAPIGKISYDEYNFNNNYVDLSTYAGKWFAFKVTLDLQGTDTVDKMLMNMNTSSYYKLSASATVNINNAYSITYDGGIARTSGGSKTLVYMQISHYHTIKTFASIFTKPKGYVFKEWSYSGHTYAEGDNVALTSSNVTFTAVLEKITYGVEIRWNGLSVYTGNYTISDTSQFFQSGELELRYKGREIDGASAGNINTSNGTKLTTAELNQVANSVDLTGGKISYSIPANAANNIIIYVGTKLTTFYIDVHDDIFVTEFSDRISYQQDTVNDQRFIFSEEGLRTYIRTNSGNSMDYRKFTGGSSYLDDIEITHNPPEYIITVKAGAATPAGVIIDHSITTLSLSITSNGGSGSKSLVFGEDAMGIENKYLPYNYNISRITPISRTGYVQTGLMLNNSLKAIGTTEDLRKIYTDLITNDVTVDAPVGWEAIKLNVNLTKFKNDGTTENSTTIISYGEDYTSPSTSASVNGYAFKDFYVDINGGFLDKGESIYASDLIKSAYPEYNTLEAGYTVETINVTERQDLITYKLTMLNDVGSTSGTTLSFDITTTSLALETKTKTGYTFKGYKLVGSVSNGTVDIDNTNETITLNKVYQDVTLEPIFELKTYTISYSEGGTANYPVTGSLSSSKPTEYNVNTATITGSSLIGTLARPGYQYHTFNPLQIEKGSTEDKTFTVNWTAINYTVTINLDGGSRNSTETSFGYNPSSLETSAITKNLGVSPTRRGYTFARWSVVATPVDSVTPAVSGSTLTIPSKFYGNFTVKALWNKIPYDISYDLGSTDNYPISGDITPKHTTYDIETDSITYSTSGLSRSGFSSPVLSISGIQTSVINKDSTGDKAVKVTWPPNTYKISLNANSGTGASISKTSYKPSDILTASTTVTVNKGSRTGYVLDSITIAKYVGPEAKKPTVSGNTVTILSGAWGDFTIQLNWKPISYKIEFKDGEKVIETRTYKYDSELGALTTTSKTGYTFDGWYVSGKKISNDTTNLITTDNAELTAEARFTPITYKVAFETNGVGEQGIRVVIYDTAIGTLPTLALHGYKFEGWYDGNTDRNGSGKQVTLASKNLESTAGDTVTLYAKWKANQYSVTYNKTKYGTPTVVNYKTGNNDSPALAIDPLVVDIAATSQAGWSVSRSLAEGTLSNITFDNSNNKVFIKRSAASNVSVVNSWRGDTYSITYPTSKYPTSKSPTATASVNFTVKNEPQTIAIPRPTQAGWTDQGLYISTNTNTATDSVESSVSNYEVTIPDNNYGLMVLLTNWDGDVHTVTVDTAGGSTTSNKSYQVSEKDITLDLPKNIVKDGYHRKSWGTPYKNGVSISDNVVSLTANTYGNFTVTMGWELEKYKFEMNYKDGVPANSINYNVNSEDITYDIGSPTLNEKTLKGYTLTKTPGESGNTNIGSIFTGYIKDGVVSNTVTSFTIPKGTYGSFKLEAIWDAYYYKVTLKSNGAGQADVVLSTVTNDKPGIITPPSDFTKDRYRLFGWSYGATTQPKYLANYSGIITDANGNRSTAANPASPMKVTLYAYWSCDDYSKMGNEAISKATLNGKNAKILFNNKVILDKPYNSIG